MKKNKIRLWDILGYLLSAFFLLLAIDKFSFESFDFKFTSNFFLWMLVAFTLVTAATYLNAFRFKILLKNVSGLTYAKSPYASFFIAHFYNAILPGKLGEIIKVHHITKKYGISYKRVLSFWVTERFIDAISFAAVCVYSTTVIVNGYVKQIQILIFLLVALSILFFFLSYRYRFIRRYLFFCIPVKRFRIYMYSIFYGCIIVVRKLIYNRVFFKFFLCSLFFVLLNIVIMFCIVKASMLPIEFISFTSLAVITSISIILQFAPSAPSGIGVIHYGIFLALSTIASEHNINVDNELQSKFVLTAVFFHSIYFISDVFFGSYFLIKEGRAVFNWRS